MIRLRQVALVALDLDAVVGELCDQLGLRVCFTDPGVATFGLRNALMMIGDQFLEVVSPAQEGTTAGRLLEKRNGDGGYMVLYEVDDLDVRETHLAALGVRVVWSGDFPTIRGRHLHPADVGGAIVSVDQPNQPGSWLWGGPDWSAHQDTSVVTAVAGVVIGANDPDAMQARWRECGVAQSVRFQPASTRSDGIDMLELVATDRSRSGESLIICGVEIRLV